MLGSGCAVCSGSLSTADHIVFAGDNRMRIHKDCFLCYQCLLPFAAGVYFEERGRFFCEEDYGIMYGPRCAQCGELIKGAALTACDLRWHPEHFACAVCSSPLQGRTYAKRDGRPWCKGCVAKEKEDENTSKLSSCHRCKKPIAQAALLLHRGLRYHAHHFSCTSCRCELTPDAREHEGKLYCKEHYEKAVAPKCFACKEAVVGRSIVGMGRHFHPEHFVCARCEMPFLDSTYRVWRDMPYCAKHYNEAAGNVCARCFEAVEGEPVTAVSKTFCADHLSCVLCELPLNPRSKFVEWDLRPACSDCWESLPTETRRRANRYFENERKAEKEREKKEGKRETP
ncbi:hypothetical protein M427DRAFT_153426 [Gonapodya prolifera JEL478]|uniref:LIM zinc-binding domain-containing protein n=1 Tax=Gonapodya prolifera (strain JEL478) TaxID=1344416 RepID=A0A139ANH4_GONPJ|nr:hypothetical protein M427DRAFT_153426 [Gonapodya prolifera JEL478]|eukprot:KXS18289.1 hypothetical protein M427DRAFT_153426 [Gonapodya prolifera JEL478]